MVVRAIEARYLPDLAERKKISGRS
jgi:hypothetical protein